jgi:hypothetical protein
MFFSGYPAFFIVLNLLCRFRLSFSSRRLVRNS